MLNNSFSVSNVLLSIPQAFQEEIITDSGLKLYLDPTYNKNFHVSVTAKIEALPKKYNPKYQRVFDRLKVGDEVAISYQVVADFAFSGDGERFMLVTEGNDRYREFVNGKGEWIRVYALPGKIAPIWVGCYLDSRMDIVDGAQGTQSDVERWMSQFQFGKTDIYSFNNFFAFAGKDYWKCNLTDIFAKKVDGHWVAIGNRILCQPFDEEVPAEVKNEMLSTERYLNIGDSIKVRYQDRAKVFSDPDKRFKRGEIVGFDSKYLEKYQFNGKDYYLIHRDRVLGTWKKQKTA